MFCLPGSAPWEVATLSLPHPFYLDLQTWKRLSAGVKQHLGLKSSRGEPGFPAQIMLPCWPRNSRKAKRTVFSKALGMFVCYWLKKSNLNLHGKKIQWLIYQMLWGILFVWGLLHSKGRRLFDAYLKLRGHEGSQSGAALCCRLSHYSPPLSCSCLEYSNKNPTS